ncbi:TonB-dependent receptor [bacterium]|nr:MAG: TonB-dependent receptor [bacterium]
MKRRPRKNTQGVTAVPALTGLLLCLLLGSSRIAAQDTTSIFRLSIEELMNVSVEVSTAMKSATSYDEAPAAVYVITREDMDRMGLRTLGAALNFVPGFTVGKSILSGHQKNIYVRGEFSSLSEGILILRDGQRLNDGITGGAMAFTPDYLLDNVKQIEVLRGPASALYGANAFVAVVNIISSRPGNAPRSFFSTQAGNRGSIDLHGQHTLTVGKKTDAVVYGSLFQLDDPIKQRDIHQSIYDSTSDTFIPREFLNRTNREKTLLANLGASLNYHNLELDAYLDGSRSRNHWGSGSASNADSLQNEHQTKNFRMGAKYTAALMKKHRLTSLASYSIHRSKNDYKMNNFRSVLSPDLNPSGASFLLESDLQTSTLNMESFAELNLSRDHRTVLGLHVQVDRIEKLESNVGANDVNNDGIFDIQASDDSLEILFGRSVNTVYAAFLQHTWSPSERLIVTGGTRFDKYTDFGLRVSPRLTVVYRPVRSFIVKGLYGRAFRAPTFFETHQSDLNAIDVIENPNLKPETIETWEMQLTLKPSVSLSLSVNAFLNDVQHVIRPVAEQSGVPTQSKFQNAGSRDWRGVEIDLQYAPQSNITFFGNYSYTQAADEKLADVEDPVYGIPQHSVNLALNLTRGKYNLNLNAFSRFGWNDVPEYNSSTVKLDRIDLVPYTIVNARFMVKNIWKSLTLSLDIYNILNRESYFTDDRVFVPQAIAGNNRRFMAGVKYTF